MDKSRQQLIQFLESNDLMSVVTLVKQNRRQLSSLVRLAYDKETLTGWRAIKAIGIAARAIVDQEYSFLRETIRKLLWSLSDESGGIGWSAPEIIGEIVCSNPERFQDIIPIISAIYDIEEEVFRPGILYALSRIAEERSDLIAPYKDLAIRALSDMNPLVRYFGLEVISRIKSRINVQNSDAVDTYVRKLSVDTAEVWVYNENNFSSIQIAEAASGMWQLK
jgi:hypothetical protein